MEGHRTKAAAHEPRRADSPLRSWEEPARGRGALVWASSNQSSETVHFWALGRPAGDTWLQQP